MARQPEGEIGNGHLSQDRGIGDKVITIALKKAAAEKGVRDVAGVSSGGSGGFKSSTTSSGGKSGKGQTLNLSQLMAKQKSDKDAKKLEKQQRARDQAEIYKRKPGRTGMTSSRSFGEMTALGSSHVSRGARKDERTQKPHMILRSKFAAVIGLSLRFRKQRSSVVLFQLMYPAIEIK